MLISSSWATDVSSTRNALGGSSQVSLTQCGVKAEENIPVCQGDLFPLGTSVRRWASCLLVFSHLEQGKWPVPTLRSAGPRGVGCVGSSLHLAWRTAFMWTPQGWQRRGLWALLPQCEH